MVETKHAHNQRICSPDATSRKLCPGFLKGVCDLGLEATSSSSGFGVKFGMTGAQASGLISILTSKPFDGWTLRIAAVATATEPVASS